MKHKNLMDVEASLNLTPLQLELLKIYSFNPTNEELLQIKELLTKLFAHRITEFPAKSDSEDFMSETGSLQTPSEGVETPHFLSDVIGIMTGPEGDELAEIISREL
ncbi:MAG TPA: hypothetical protein VK168_08910 [Saprospiraceae bacterium]|nr:hypothetical protein [Saprospiraceae bacterium]